VLHIAGQPGAAALALPAMIAEQRQAAKGARSALQLQERVTRIAKAGTQIEISDRAFRFSLATSRYTSRGLPARYLSIRRGGGRQIADCERQCRKPARTQDPLHGTTNVSPLWIGGIS